jgi:hypothetical protein
MALSAIEMETTPLYQCCPLAARVLLQYFELADGIS